MFVTVRYGANCQELVNLQSRVLVLTAHLRRKCQCGTGDCIDLVDEAGALMNLSKVENPAAEYASKYLRERQRYILVRVIREQSTEATCYESLLENLGKHHPDLADRLQKLSGNTPMREQWRKGSLQRRAQPKKSSEPKSTPR